MLDAPAVIRTYLAGQSGLTALCADRIWAEAVVPPPGYLPTDGGALTFRIRGGGADYSRAVINPSVQFKCYGDGLEGAQAVYRALYEALDGGVGISIKATAIDILGQSQTDEDTGWPFVLTFGSFWLNAR